MHLRLAQRYLPRRDSWTMAREPKLAPELAEPLA